MIKNIETIEKALLTNMRLTKPSEYDPKNKIICNVENLYTRTECLNFISNKLRENDIYHSICLDSKNNICITVHGDNYNLVQDLIDKNTHKYKYLFRDKNILIEIDNKYFINIIENKKRLGLIN